MCMYFFSNNTFFLLQVQDMFLQSVLIQIVFFLDHFKIRWIINGGDWQLFSGLNERSSAVQKWFPVIITTWWPCWCHQQDDGGPQTERPSKLKRRPARIRRERPWSICCYHAVCYMNKWEIDSQVLVPVPTMHIHLLVCTLTVQYWLLVLE